MKPGRRAASNHTVKRRGVRGARRRTLRLVLGLALAATVIAAPAAARAATGANSSASGPLPTSPVLTARAALLVEASTGRVLYASNADAELPIASTTKLMTALLTLEHVHRLSAMFTAPNYYAASADSQIGLRPGERMSVHDLLLALLIPSADDAAEDLAYNVGHHSVARFVAMMNARARQLGLAHTHYSTPSGLDTPGNYSSASDLVRLATYLLEHHRFFRHAVSLAQAELRTGSHRRYVFSTNTLLSRVRWITGIKTGHTLDAGYVLVGSATRDGMTLVSAVLGTPTETARDANTLALLNYGFANFRVAPLVVRGSVVARPGVSDSPGVRVNVVAAAGVTRVVARRLPLTTRVEVPAQVAGPRRDHAVVGSVVVLSGRRVIARVPAEITRALPAISPLTLVGRFLVRPSTLLVVVLLIAGGSLLVRRRRRRGTGTAPVAADGLVAGAQVAPDRARVDTGEPAPGSDLEATTELGVNANPGAGAGLGGGADAAAADRERRRAERAARRRARMNEAQTAVLPDRERK
jgi:D-alanyl-D-alanine carboxypeptidase (penicillin-binding protein 5/6)